MSMITIQKPITAKAFILSVLSFSQDMKLEISPEGVRIPLKCDIPDKMRLEFKSNIFTASEHVNVCIKEAQRLYRAIDLVCSQVSDLNPIELEVSTKGDFLIYKNGSTQFKIGLVTERALIGCIDSDEFKMFDDVYSMQIPMSNIKELFRYNAIVRSSDARVFIIKGAGNEIAAKLEDEESLSSGMVSIKMADSLTAGSFTPLILKADMFKSLIKFQGESILFHYTDKKAIIVETTSSEPPLSTMTRVMFAPKKSKRG